MTTETKNEIENAGRKLRASVKAAASKVKNSNEEYVKDSSTAKIPRHNPSPIPQYKRILVPDDNSDLFDKALTHAIYLSNVTGAEIVILNMVEDIGKIQQTTISGTPAQEETETRGEVLAESTIADQKNDIQITIEGPAKQMMEERIRHCKEAGAMNQISYKMLTGKKPVEEILDLSYKMSIDLIIMASSKVTSLVPGPTSTIRKVIEGAKCPVMVIQFSHFWNCYDVEIIGVVEKFSNDGITIVNPPPYQARVLDLGTGAEKTLTQSEDLFCAGHTTLANGTILFAGGSTLLHNLGARVDRVEG